MRPQRRREPGFEHVVVATQFAAITRGFGLRLRGRFVARDEDFAAGAVPGRDAVAPPELARDAPVLDVAEPVAVGVDPVLGHELDAAVLHQFEATRRESVHLHEPLVGEIGLDHLAGAVAARHLQLVRLFLDQQFERGQVGQHLLARDVAIQPAILLGRDVVDGRRGREDVDHRQVVAPADFVVVEVVRRGDLDAAGAEVLVDIGVGDDRNLALGQRQLQPLADQRGVTLVFRMHGHGDVAEHGFRTRRRDHQLARTISQRIRDRPQLAVFFLADDFQIGNRGQQHRIPVHEPLAAIDQALRMQLHEGFDDRFRQAFVHREAFARPVAGHAHAPHLATDRAAGFFLPLPHAFDELFAAERVAGLALAFEQTRHHHLGRDAGVVGAELPQRALAAHALVTDQRVHDGVLERVAHVQGAGHVRRRQHDRVRLALALRREAAAGFPLRIPARLDVPGIEALVHA
jgi:hypothetical protein